MNTKNLSVEQKSETLLRFILSKTGSDNLMEHTKNELLAAIRETILQHEDETREQCAAAFVDLLRFSPESTPQKQTTKH